MFSYRKFGLSCRRAAGLSALMALVLAFAAGNSDGVLGADSASKPAQPIAPLEVRFTLDTPGGGEIFPALTSGAPTEYWPIAVLTLENTSVHPLVASVSAEVHDWSRRSTRIVNLAPHEALSVQLSPELLTRAYENGEIRPATLEVRAEILGSSVGYDETRPVYLHSASDFFWGEKFANAQFIARWVTPHDPAVLRLVSLARRYVPRGRLAGYELAGHAAPTVATQVENEARAVFAAMEQLGVSYVDSVSTFGHYTAKAERVRLPRETLSMSGANCIDMSVAFASAMENLGMEPVIVLVPGHAFTGVRLAPGSSRILYVDLTVMADGTFDAAERRAQTWLQKIPKNEIRVIDITSARAHQIYPMPSIVPPVTQQKA